MKRLLVSLVCLLSMLSTIGFAEQKTDLQSGSSLDALPFLQSYSAKRISSADKKGGNRDCMRIEPGETITLADINGPGCITHIWCTVNGEKYYPRKLVLRMYWDHETEPSVEAPLGDFFGVGHGINRNYVSLPFVVSSNGRARNCFFKMPFATHALIQVTNEGLEPVGNFYYYVDYRVTDDLPRNATRFHAQYNQAYPCTGKDNYVILEASGQGHYVGCNLSVEGTARNWWGEGDDMIYVDGETTPSLAGTGTEDYFCDAWGMRESMSPYYGCPLCEGFHDPGQKTTMYRFHIEDPIPFRKSIRVTIEHGSQNDRADNLSSVAYWYQTEPHTPFTKLPRVYDRLSEDGKILYEAQVLDKRAKTAVAADECADIIADCEKFVTLHPDHATVSTARTVAGLMDEKLGEYKAAQKIYRQIASQFRKSAVGQQARAQLRMVRRQAQISREFKTGGALILEMRNAFGYPLDFTTYRETPDWIDSFAKSQAPGLFGTGSRCTNAERTDSMATVTPAIPAEGRYAVYVTWGKSANAYNVPYVVYHKEGTTEVVLTQDGGGGEGEPNCDQWHILGAFWFSAGRDASRAAVSIKAGAAPLDIRPAGGHERRVYMDAVKFVLIEPAQPQPESLFQKLLFWK
jgi:hypothetical protein